MTSDETTRQAPDVPFYRGALDKVFGPAWRDGHQLVKRWLGAIRAGDARSTAK